MPGFAKRSTAAPQTEMPTGRIVAMPLARLSMVPVAARKVLPEMLARRTKPCETCAQPPPPPPPLRIYVHRGSL